MKGGAGKNKGKKAPRPGSGGRMGLLPTPKPPSTRQGEFFETCKKDMSNGSVNSLTA